MKKLLPFFFLLFANITFGQTSLVNFKEGTWKNKQTWLFQQIPADTNDVVLMHDIVVDTNAICRSLTTNGYNVTIANGFNLKITGKDTIGTVPDNDTLISEIELLYQGDGISKEGEHTSFRRYEYDAMKRVSRTLENNHTGEGDIKKKFFYLNDSKLPYKTILHDPCINKYFQDEGVCYQYYDTSYYWYDNSGIVLKDSVISFYSDEENSITTTNKYLVIGDSVFNYSTDSGYMPDYLGRDTTHYYRQLKNGNIVKQVQADINRIEYWDYNATYDRRPNPLYKNSVHLPVLLMEQLPFDDTQSLNNTLTHEEIYQPLGLKYHLLYKYKSNGYPDEVFVVDYDQDGNIYEISICKFHYTK